MAPWRVEGANAIFAASEEGWSAAVDDETFRVTLFDQARTLLVALATGENYPSAGLAVRVDGVWRTLGRPDERVLADDRVVATWREPAARAVLSTDPEVGIQIALQASGAEAVALALAVGRDEHFYGLGERFNKLDQRGALIELWVKNGAAGGDTYKPIPFVASSVGYGVSIDTSRRVFAALAHPTVPDVVTLTVDGNTLVAWLIPGPTPTDVVRRYTAWIGRPAIPPAWFFRPWKSRDWRVETQQKVVEDVIRQREHDIPCGVKLIDGPWETVGHSFVFDPEKYPDVPGMMRTLREAGLELVLWLSPSMTAGTAEYDECARKGFLITDASGHPYLHRLGNEPGWEGTTIDFSNPEAVAWWQERLRRLLDLGARGFKTDFGEQVPEDAWFANGKSGAEMHNLLPVLYNRASWEVVKDYDGVLLARSAWTGSQRYPGIWAGDQSADFSPWGGLPTVIVAGQSAGWSGFPYWGSDVGGYFNPPDDEVFARWAQFGAVSPVMEAHGLGRREAWEFAPETLAIYRAAAQLHDRLVPYSLAAAREAHETGLPIMRAMALLYPEHPEAHLDWVQYQFLYGPHLLAAPVYSWGKERQIWFPRGVWIDIETGERHIGPIVKRVPAPLTKLPLYARAGSVIPLQFDPDSDDLTLQLYAGDGSEPTRLTLRDGTTIAFDPAGDGGGRVETTGISRRYRLQVPFATSASLSSIAGDARIDDGEATWVGPVTIEIGQRV